MRKRALPRTARPRAMTLSPRNPSISPILLTDSMTSRPIPVKKSVAAWDRFDPSRSGTARARSTRRLAPSGNSPASMAMLRLSQRFLSSTRKHTRAVSHPVSAEESILIRCGIEASSGRWKRLSAEVIPPDRRHAPFNLRTRASLPGSSSNSPPSFAVIPAAIVPPLRPTRAVPRTFSEVTVPDQERITKLIVHRTATAIVLPDDLLDAMMRGGSVGAREIRQSQSASGQRHKGSKACQGCGTLHMTECCRPPTKHPNHDGPDDKRRRFLAAATVQSGHGT